MPPCKLTPKLVRQLGQSGVRSEHRDTVVPGLVLRVGASGRKSWAYCYSLRGRNRRLTLGSLEKLDLAAARASAKEARRKVGGGGNPAEEKRTARVQAEHSVGSLVDAMLEAVTLRPSTLKEWKRIRAVELEPIERRPAADLTRGDVRFLLQKILKRSGWTANHTLDVLRRAYSWGLEFEKVGASPCAGIRKPYRAQASDRVLSVPEIRALWRALAVLGEEQYPDAVRLLLFTGVRKGAALGAQGREVHDATWTVPAARNKGRGEGHTHLVPLSPQASAVVRRRLAASPTDYLFPSYYQRRVDLEPCPYMTIPSQWIRRLKAAVIWQIRRELGHGLRAKMAPWHLHNLRHTMSTQMVEVLGVDETVADLILGHTPPGRRGAAGVYQRAHRLPERRAALALWGAWVEGLSAEKSNILPMVAR